MLLLTRARASALLFGAAAGAALPVPGRAQSGAQIRLATLPVEAAADAYYARDMGFFTKAGIDVAIEPLQNSAAIVSAVVSNASDIGFSDINALATAHQKGLPTVLIAPAAEYTFPATERIAAIVVPANSPISVAKDLNGKIVAVLGVHGFQENAVRAWIDQNGGDSSTCKFVELGDPAMPAALDAGRIDAALVVEPFVGIAARNRRVLVYGFDSVAKDFLTTGWFATPQWAQANRDVVGRFAAAMRETALWANANPAKSADILNAYTKIDPAVIATMTRVHWATQLTPASIQPLVDLAAKYNGFPAFPAQELLPSLAR